MSILIPKAPKGGGRVDIYIIRRNCTLWFWQCKNFANSQLLVKNKATGTPHGMYYIQPSLASYSFTVRCYGALYTYINVGLSALYQHCTLKDDISYLLPTWLSAGTGKLKRKHHFIGWQERTNKMKNKSCATNFATQQPFSLLLLLQEPFLLAERKKDVLLVYGSQPKPIHKYKFIHLRIYILMDWMNWTNCGAIAQPCHVQYWVVALFLSASKNSCMISVTFHL